MNKYLHFFDKRGDYLNFQYDDSTDTWSGAVDYGLISSGLLEDLQIYVLEEVFDTDTGQLRFSHPIADPAFQPGGTGLVVLGCGEPLADGIYGPTTLFGTTPGWVNDDGYIIYDLDTGPYGYVLADPVNTIMYHTAPGAPTGPALPLAPVWAWAATAGATGPGPQTLYSITIGASSAELGRSMWAAFSPTGPTEHFLYGFTAGATDSWLVKERARTYPLLQQGYETFGPTYSNAGQRIVQGVQSEALQINAAFHPSDEAKYLNWLTLFDAGGSAIARVEVYGEGEGEDERLRAVLQTLGHDIVEEDSKIFDVQDINEPEPDWLLLNRKRKELIHEYAQVFPYVGSYKALINIIKYFGYTDVRLKEYWRNVDARSKGYGKLRHTDIVEIFDKRANFRDSISVPSKVYKKTNMFGLFYDITRETGEFDDQGVPEVEEVYTFSPEEVLVKMFALKNKLKDHFMPLSAHIVDIVGEAVFFGRYDAVARADSARIDAVSLAIRPGFDVLPSPTGWLGDLRPMYHYGCPVGPDLTMDGQTDLLSWRIGIGNTAYVGGVLDGIQTYRLTAVIPGPTAYVVEAVVARDPNSGQTAYAGYEIADMLVDEWNSTETLSDAVLAYQEGGTSGVIRFVQRTPDGDGVIQATWFSNTTGVIPSGKYTLPGPTGGTALSINVSSGPSGSFGPSGAPMSYYSDCFLAYFDDINQTVHQLNDAEGIPVGYATVLRNTSFDITWDNAQVTFNELDTTDPDQLGPTGGVLYAAFTNSYLLTGWTGTYPHPDLPAGATYFNIGVTAGVTGFPYAGFPSQNVYTWENLGYYSHYEMQWLVTYEGPGPFTWSHDSGRRAIRYINEYPLVLPYEGTYTVELRLWDLYNTKSWNIQHGAIRVRMQDNDFIGWYRHRELDYTWDTQRLPVQSDYSRLDRRTRRDPYLTWGEYTSTWELPLHPNEEVGMADITYNSIDAIEFYQNIVEEPTDRLIDRDPYYFELVEDSPASWNDMYHLWWDVAGSKVTQVNVAAFATGPTSYVFASLEGCPYDITDPALTITYVDGPTGFTGPTGATSLVGATGDLIYSAYDHRLFEYTGTEWRSVYASIEGFRITGLDVPATYSDAVKLAAWQLNEALWNDPRSLPVLRSFIWHYEEEYAADYSLVPYVRGISVGFDKHGRHRFRWDGMTGDSRSYATTNLGYVGDIPTAFEFYAVPGTAGTGTVELPGMTAAYVVGATTLVGLADELNGATAQTYPGIADFTYNLVLGYSGWAGGSGPTGPYTEVKVQAVAKAFVNPQRIGVTYSGGVVGTVVGRSVICNPTYDDLRVLKYAQQLPLLSLVNFCYDNSRIHGKVRPVWRLTKEGDPSFADRYCRNRYFSYMFTQRGSYTLSLSIEDTNGNTKEVSKKELLKIV